MGKKLYSFEILNYIAKYPKEKNMSVKLTNDAKEPEISRELNKMDANLDRLGATVERLEQRLACVVSTNNQDIGENAEDPKLSTDLSQRLFANNASIRSAERRILELLDNCEL